MCTILCTVLFFEYSYQIMSKLEGMISILFLKNKTHWSLSTWIFVLSFKFGISLYLFYCIRQVSYHVRDSVSFFILTGTFSMWLLQRSLHIGHWKFLLLYRVCSCFSQCKYPSVDLLCNKHFDALYDIPYILYLS